jgi:hypothetical protein
VVVLGGMAYMAGWKITIAADEVNVSVKKKEIITPSTWGCENRSNRRMTSSSTASKCSKSWINWAYRSLLPKVKNYEEVAH